MAKGRKPAVKPQIEKSSKKKKSAKKTTIRLILLNRKNKKVNSFTYKYIKFPFCDKIKLDDLIKKKIQILKLDIPSEKIEITQQVILEDEDGNIKETFLLPIYINKINNFYINLKKQKEGFFFEFFYYSIREENLPKSFLYKKSKNLKIFDSHKQKFKKRINIINEEREIAAKYLKNLPLDSNSYKICIRINNKGEEISPSIHELKLEKKRTPKISKLKANKDDLNKINQLIKDFKATQSLTFIQKKYQSLKDDNILKTFTNNYKYSKLSTIELPNIDENDIEILKEYLLKIIIQYFFIDLNIIHHIEDITKYLLTIIENIFAIIEDIENFANEKEDATMLKFRLFRSTMFNIYSISKNKIDSIKRLSEYKQEILEINWRKKTNAYTQAINFLKNVAKNLKENSALYDILLQYNSGFSHDISLIKGEDKEDFTKNELKLLGVKDVTKHLQEILPKFIVRYTFQNDVYAFFSELNDIIFINEKKTFDKNTIENYDKKNNYVLPIVILLIHECWGHMKVSLTNKSKKNRNSPIRNHLRSEDFKEIQIKKYDEKTKKYTGESGLGIERLILGPYNNKILSKYILNYEASNNENLLKIDLWIQPTFEEFQKKIKNNYEQFYKTSIDIESNKNKEEEDETDEGMKNIYFEDDSSLLTLAKV